MLKSHKSWSVVMAICLCLALLAPVFVAPQAAEAASTNTVERSLIAGQVDDTIAVAGANLGVVKVVIDSNAMALAVGSRLTVSYPSDVIDRAHDSNAGVGGGFGVAVPVAAAYPGAVNSGVQVVVPATSGFAVADLVNTNLTNSKFTINVVGATTPALDGVFYIYFYDLDTSRFAGDFTVSLIAEPNSVFTTSPSLVVGSVKTDAGTQTMVKSINNITGTGGVNAPVGAPATGNGLLNTITIFENAANTIGQRAADTIELKIMTKGYTWTDAAESVVRDWGFGFGALGGPGVVNAAEDTITYTGLVAGIGGAPYASAGLLHFSNLGLKIDDSVARVGQEVEVRVKGTGVTEQTFVVAKYCDFETQVLEGTTTEIMAGREEQKIGEFYIEESAPGTLVEDRVITFELPEGYEWDNNAAFGNSNYEVVNSSAITLDHVSYPDALGAKNLGRVMKVEVTNTSATARNGAKIKFKKLEVMVSPAAKGDLNIEISGKAGVSGSVKVATTSPMVTLEATPVDVVLGVQDQKVADVTLKEIKPDALVDRRDRAVADRTIVLQLDEDFAFAKVPKVEVVSGDMVLDTLGIKTGGDRDNGGTLSIPIKAGSLKTAAEIKISDIYLTANRNAPEGPVKIKTAKGTAAVGNATNETLAFTNDRAASATIANNKSVPPSENIGATTGEFKIGSNVYSVNGMTKVMDAAPYIKDARTYVPLRYLGYALGLTDDDIVWDSAAQKATFTKGSTVVELTVNSTTMSVNGEAKTIEVAPELSGDRMMLPARFVAEAFGAKVGWDASSQAVVIEN